MAPKSPFVQQTHHQAMDQKGGPKPEFYPVISSKQLLVLRASQRLSVLDQWRTQKRYKLRSDEKRELFALRRHQELCTTASYGTTLAVWWVSGPRNTRETWLYRTLSQFSEEAVQNLLRMQPYKQAWATVPRMLFAVSVSVPWAFVASVREDAYFETLQPLRSSYGAFARYLKQEGDRVAAGEQAQPYFHGRPYDKPTTTRIRSDAVPAGTRVTGTAAEMQRLSSDNLYRGGGVRSAAEPEAEAPPPQPPARSSQGVSAAPAAPTTLVLQSQQVQAEAPAPSAAPAQTGMPTVRVSLSPQVAAAAPPGLEPEAARQRRQGSSRDDTDAFFRHVFGA
eukprot:Rhum_TRINITY_DN3274_c0_g1::Rhum_TRINITY_DN3274_c0_g1_i1::g.10157::m.10157